MAATSKAIYGLIGYPLGHSFSREFFNQKFTSEGIDAEYLNFEIDDINRLMEIISEHPSLNGLNVTAPYKEAVIPFLTELDEEAQAIGAVNVIKIIRDKKNNEVIGLKGYNSDTPGFEQTMLPLLPTKPVNVCALVLGTGGAAKAVARALEKHNIKVKFVSRRKSAITLTYEEITRAMVSQHKIVINATPLGKYPDIDQCPDFPYRFLTKQHLCYDLIYNPDETLFMRNAREMGATVKNGLEMLLLQAFISYSIWTDMSPNTK
ncbi:MAG: shikimate dehydrogenase [Muribaculaceae bacterium]|nr:shikimate dehydrogenase [Muribaculaceae bacterium]